MKRRKMMIKPRKYEPLNPEGGVETDKKKKGI